ncbi:MAG: DUF805 domain-containing protein [Sphingomonas bacterium]|nr:DUF805 domain-containing protein [Sphingomonas bacterium]
MGVFENITQSLNKFADFRSRASRSEFWSFFCFMLIAQSAARLIDVGLAGGSYRTGPVAMLTGLLLFAPQVSVAVRRLHDVNRSGRELMVPCFVLLASPLILLFGSLLGRIVALGYAGVLLLLFGQLMLMLARKGSSVPNLYGACPTVFSFDR